jgi:hypothetical protein
MALLQVYPLESVGGIDSILQTAVELKRRREELEAVKTNTFGSRFRDTIWRGFTNQSAFESRQRSPDPSESPEEGSRGESDEGQTHPDDIASSTPSLTSRLANAFWQGITNQSAMEAPPSPVSPLPSSPASPLPPPSPASPMPPPPSSSPLPPVTSLSPTSSVSSTTTSFWGYAEKLRDSDTAASLAKVSTNWRVKAMEAWSHRSSTSTSPSPSPLSQAKSEGHKPSRELANAPRVGSLSDPFHNEVYSPPPRPAYFRPPRDSMLPQPRRSSPSSPPPTDSGDDTPSTQAKGLRDSLASLKGLVTTTSEKSSPKSGPRPLLLSSSSLLTKSTPTPLPTPHMRLKNDSTSSITHPISEIARKIRRHESQSEWESDVTTESRIIPLNRHSISPMAPQFHLARSRRSQSSSSEKIVSGQDLVSSRGLISPSARSEGSVDRRWGGVDVGLDSPLTLPSSPPLPTPPPPFAASIVHAVTDAYPQRDSAVISESSLSVRALEAPSQARKLVRKKTPPPSRPDYTSDSAPDAPLPSPRSRSKRSPHLTKLHIQKSGPPGPPEVPNTLALPILPDDHDNSVTPRASAFHEVNEENSISSGSPKFPAPPPLRTRKVSSEECKAHGDIPEPRTRQIPSINCSPRARKVSEHRLVKHAESGAEEGDDEGYDELLSAYESEDSVVHRVVY